MATPKSTIERLHRHTRPKKLAPRMADMTDRVTPKKAANNDPHRGGNPRLHNEELRLAVQFLAEHCGKTGDKLRQEVSTFEQRGHLKNLVEHLIAVRLGGWRQDGGHFVNDSGRVATPQNWRLVGDRLAPLGHEPVNYDVDWLLEVKQHLEE